MMAAMMLPPTIPVAVRYARMVQTRRALALCAFAAGYLLLWAATGVPAWFANGFVGGLRTDRVLAFVTAGVYAICGVYQFTPLKHRCLTGCHAPVSLLLRYSAWRGPTRHWRVGMHHGAFCVGCCWPLFLVMTLMGAMDVRVLAAFVAIVALEKLWPKGVWVSRAVGVTALVVAAAVLWNPSLAHTLAPASMAGMDM